MIPPWSTWPSPLLDPQLEVDGFAGLVTHDGSPALLLASGARVPVDVSVPVPGVLRVRTGDVHHGRPSPMLAEFTDTPADVDTVAGTIGGPAVAVSTTAAGFSLGGTVVAPQRIVGGGWLVTSSLGTDDALYGGGESFPSVDLRGRYKRLVNVETHGQASTDASYLTVPFVWSDAGWGLFAHTGGPARLDAGSTSTDRLALATEDHELDLFCITGADPSEILGRYLALTGLPGTFPDWALGVWTSRCSYLSEAEIHEILDGYAEADCPVDVVHVDAWVEGNVVADLACNWTVDRDRFPEGWGRRLSDRGVRLSLWHNPYVVADSPLAKMLAADGLLVAEGDGLARTADMASRAVVDFTEPSAVAWWQDQVRRVADEEGAAAFKPDFAEELPIGGELADGRPARAARNEYAVRYQRATHEAMAGRAAEDEGVALFCRSGTAGAQRYPCHWVGDTPSTWDGLSAALRACESLSLSGFGFVASDVGGFWTGGSHEWVKEAFAVMDSSGVGADVDPELFARWAQWGALSPVMRFHGTGRREPWAYPGPWGAIAVDACRLRAALRPYLTRTAQEASTTGTPMLRPMPYAYPRALGSRAATMQYLLGADVLVAPLLAPGGRRELWVPPGEWTPLLAPTAVEGPAWVEVQCAPTEFPAWVRAGTEVLS